MVKVGKVKYLNTLPLFYEFNGFKLVEGHPSELVFKLRKGKIQAGIVSSVEYLLNRDLYFFLPNVSIASKGKVCSVLLLSNKPIEIIRRIKLTSNSLTSKFLLRFIFEEGYKRLFEEVEEEEDAILSIGDEALLLKEEYEFNWDLGQEWFRITGLPFVFALFLVRKEVPLMYTNLIRTEIFSSLRNFYRDLKADRLEVEGFEKDFLRSYFGTCISYSLGEEEIEGLRLFFRYAKKFA